MIQKINKLRNTLKWLKNIDKFYESLTILNAQPLIKRLKGRKISSLSEVEFKVFSQWGDDGIIQWLIINLEIESNTFIEFGVENYIESNTRFLLMQNNWSGLVLDSSLKNINEIKNSYFYWMYDITAKDAFVDSDNINKLISSQFPHGKIGLLHIDIDGNDYWIWKAINVNPEIVIVEYNSLWGIERTITTPYQKNFSRTKAHYSNLYFGASLRALNDLANTKGYSFIGCNSAGNNAYFIRKDLINEIVHEVTVDEGFVNSKFRESRDKNNKLTFKNRVDSLSLIKGIPVYDTSLEKIVPL